MGSSRIDRRTNDETFGDLHFSAITERYDPFLQRLFTHYEDQIFPYDSKEGFAQLLDKDEPMKLESKLDLHPRKTVFPVCHGSSKTYVGRTISQKVMQLSVKGLPTLTVLFKSCVNRSSFFSTPFLISWK